MTGFYESTALDRMLRTPPTPSSSRTRGSISGFSSTHHLRRATDVQTHQARTADERRRLARPGHEDSGGHRASDCRGSLDHFTGPRPKRRLHVDHPALPPARPRVRGAPAKCQWHTERLRPAGRGRVDAAATGPGPVRRQRGRQYQRFGGLFRHHRRRIDRHADGHTLYRAVPGLPQGQRHPLGNIQPIRRRHCPPVAGKGLADRLRHERQLPCLPTR